MYQLFLNTFLNAIHAITSVGTITVQKRVTTYWKTGGNLNPMMCVSIGDNGGGLDPFQEKKIFERFESSRPGGSGLGLSICKDIITIHNGTMDLKSEVGKGTTVNYYFPITFE
ncbi:ATP-binding protein [Desulfosarcina ovata]|uniref:ATP-binding protein n=1 Tax=Desulfosarcina ovata TaxID=83564 RepID=UPI0022B1208C|nr:ATP-binding protein [Desulfosarcina ovata]